MIASGTMIHRFRVRQGLIDISPPSWVLCHRFMTVDEHVGQPVSWQMRLPAGMLTSRQTLAR